MSAQFFCSTQWANGIVDARETIDWQKQTLFTHEKEKNEENTIDESNETKKKNLFLEAENEYRELASTRNHNGCL